MFWTLFLRLQNFSDKFWTKRDWNCHDERRKDAKSIQDCYHGSSPLNEMRKWIANWLTCQKEEHHKLAKLLTTKSLKSGHFNGPVETYHLKVGKIRGSHTGLLVTSDAFNTNKKNVKLQKCFVRFLSHIPTTFNWPVFPKWYNIDLAFR